MENGATIAVGDRFTKKGNPFQVFEVVGVLKERDLPPHARLKPVGANEPVRLIAVSVLADRRFYGRSPR